MHTQRRNINQTLRQPNHSALRSRQSSIASDVDKHTSRATSSKVLTTAEEDELVRWITQLTTISYAPGFRWYEKWLRNYGVSVSKQLTMMVLSVSPILQLHSNGSITSSHVILNQIWLSNNEHEHEQEKSLFLSFVFEKFLLRLELFTNVRECNTQTVTYSM